MLDIINESLITKSAYEFTNKHIKPIASKIDSNDSFPHELWQTMGAHGLLGICAPKKYGGAELGYEYLCKIMQAISYGSAAVGLSYAAHSNLCINQIAQYGNDSQQEKFLPNLICGKHVGAIAISEISHGSDALGMELDAKEQNSHYILNGSKMWITNGPDANIIVVYARTKRSERKADGITAFIVTSDMHGLKKMKKINKMGMRGSNTCELLFENVAVPKENILGEANKAKDILLSGLDCERVILAAGPIGIMEAALEMTTQYSRMRRQFNCPIGNFQLIQAKLADMYTAYHSSIAYLEATVKRLNERNCPTEAAASVILLAAENATKVCLDAIQIFGGNGYTNDYEVSRLLRDAKLYEIGAGTSEIRRLIIGRKVFSG